MSLYLLVISEMLAHLFLEAVGGLWIWHSVYLESFSWPSGLHERTKIKEQESEDSVEVLQKLVAAHYSVKESLLKGQNRGVQSLMGRRRVFVGFVRFAFV